MPQVEFDPRVLTPVLLDTHSVYRLQALHFTSADDVFRITGTFPRVRYFSFQVQSTPHKHTRMGDGIYFVSRVIGILFCPHHYDRLVVLYGPPRCPSPVPRQLTLPSSPLVPPPPVPFCRATTLAASH